MPCVRKWASYRHLHGVSAECRLYSALGFNRNSPTAHWQQIQTAALNQIYLMGKQNKTNHQKSPLQNTSLSSQMVRPYPWEGCISEHSFVWWLKDGLQIVHLEMFGFGVWGTYLKSFYCALSLSWLRNALVYIVWPLQSLLPGSRKWILRDIWNMHVVS